MKAVSVSQSKVVASEYIVEADGQVFTAEREAVTIRAAQHVVIPISEETIFGDEAEVLVQLDGYTRLEAQFESGSSISSVLDFVSGNSDSAVYKQAHNLAVEEGITGIGGKGKTVGNGFVFLCLCLAVGKGQCGTDRPCFIQFITYFGSQGKRRFVGIIIVP